LFSDGTEVTSIPAPRVQVKDVNGAGDALLAGWMWAWLHEKNVTECISYGQAAAACLLEVYGAIRNDLSPSLLEEKRKLQIR
jgi:sugar/nucleoside kinase (ribokinase family)